MPTLRCSICALNWPVDEDDYSECPQCGQPTSPISNVKSMPKAEAKSLKLHLDFERFYDEWDAEQPPERLDPVSDDAPSAVA